MHACMCVCVCVEHTVRFTRLAIPFRSQQVNSPTWWQRRTSSLSEQTTTKLREKGSNKIKQTFKFLCLVFFVGFFLFFFFFSFQLRFEINPKNHIYSQNAGFRFVLYFFSVYKKFFFIFSFVYK